jgi:outer membrane immunogenic protein
MKKFLAVAALAALIPVSALAQAAGQQHDATKKNDATNWTGFYAGLNTGGTLGSSNAQTGTSGGDYFQSASVTQINYAGNQNLTPKGYAGGLQFGYNRQIGHKWVLGLEADFGVLAASNTESATTVYSCCSPYTFTMTQKVSTDWMGTGRARVGHTVAKRGLLFVSGGAAETQLHYSSLFADNWTDIAGYTAYLVNESASASALKTGWIVGGGGEYALNKRWSARAEYLFADFGTVSRSNANLTDASGNTYTDPFTHTATLTSSVARAAVNYRF